ncbi:MAG: hypothetical protein AAF360_18280 [Pseudomonadota bacterium]
MPQFRIVTRLIARAALCFALGGGGAAYAEFNRGAAIDALRAIANDPSAPVIDELFKVGFSQATYLVDGLSVRQLNQLRRHIEDRATRLPTNIASAIRAKTPRSRGNPGGGP